MKFDDFLTNIGEFGTYQKKIYLLICIPVLSVGIQVVAAVFILAIPEHRCRIPAWSNDTYDVQNEKHERFINMSIPYVKNNHKWELSKCLIYQTDQFTEYDNYSRPLNASMVKCHSWVYDSSVFESTAVTQMDLVCDKQFASTHAQMSVMGGFLAGAFILGTLSDMYGRRKILCFSYVLNIFSGFGTIWAPEFISLAIIRFLQGVACAGIITTAFVIGIEIVGPSKRRYTGINFEFFFASGFVILALLAYLIRNWQYLELALSMPTIFYMLVWYYVPESPRWLLSQGLYEEAEVIMKKIAEGSHKELSTKILDSLDCNDNADSVPLWRIFMSRKLAVQSLIIFFNWFVVSMVYYGLSLNSVNLGGNIFVNFLLVGLAEFPAYVICILILDKMGRKPVYCTSMILGGIACILTLFSMIYLDKSLNGIAIALSTFGKFSVAASFAVVYIISGELFPTVVRNGAVGLSSCFARVGGMVAPYVAEASNILPYPYNKVVPSLTFGLFAIVAGVLALYLPETFNKRLPDSISENCSESDDYLNECEKALNGVEFSELNNFKETLDEKI